MVDLQQRQKQIVKFLMNSEDFQPVKSIADCLKCSIKTVRNDLELIEEQGIEIEKRSGKGIKISLSDVERMNLNLVISEGSNNFNNLSTESRRIKILFNLLDNTQGNTSIQNLAQKYFVSKTSIVNDLKNIEGKIRRYNLYLEKSIQGTKIIGNELDIRKVMVSVLNELISSNEQLLNLEKAERIDSVTLLELSRQFSEENVKYVEQIIEETEKLLDYRIGEPYYINLITHILILIKRTENGNRIYDFKDIENIDISDEFMYKVSKEMAKNIEKYFSIELEEYEIYFIYRYLVSSGAKVPYQNSISPKLDDKNDLKAGKMAKELIKICSEVLELDLTFDTQLYNFLILHLRPMLNRINYNISIKNPLINEINEELSEIMSLLKVIMLKVTKEFGLTSISEDEIGYIAVYFQAAMEETISKKRVIIVCSTGVGTSHLLKNRIKNHFPDWNIVDVISASHLEKNLDLSDIDLIVSTVKLRNSGKLNKPIAYVTALFNKSDAKIVRELLINEKITKEVKFDFTNIKKCLRAEHISIFNEVKCKDKELIDITLMKMFSKQHDSKLIQFVKLNNNFSISLYEKNNLIEPCIGLNIIKNSKAENEKVQFILVFNKSNCISTEFIAELYKIFNKKKLLQMLYQCNTCDEVLRNFTWS